MNECDWNTNITYTNTHVDDFTVLMTIYKQYLSLSIVILEPNLPKLVQVVILFSRYWIDKLNSYKNYNAID